MTPRYSHVGGTVWRDAGTPEEYVVGVCATEDDAREVVASLNFYRRADRIGRRELPLTCAELRDAHAAVTADRDALRADVRRLVAALREASPMMTPIDEDDDRVMDRVRILLENDGMMRPLPATPPTPDEIANVFRSASDTIAPGTP